MITAICTSCGSKNTKLPDMARSFSMRSKKPMGSYAAYNMFQWQFHSYWIYKTEKNFSEQVKQIDGTKNLYFIVADEFLLQPNDLEAMLTYVSEGNQLFIAASYIDGSLLDTLQLIPNANNNAFSLFTNPDSANLMRYSSVSLKNNTLQGTSNYGFFYYPMTQYFQRYDSSVTTVLGVNDILKPNYVAVKYGNGLIFLHLHPEVFSNYFLLTKNNKEYFEKLMSYVNYNRKTIYWDNFYRLGIFPEKDFSAFGVFLKYPPLKWALFLALATILLYILLGSKRKQKPVPVLEPNSNSSVSFVETIGRLYLQKKDHHNIVHKMVTYFLERVRNQYYLNTSQFTSEFFSSLSRKSGVVETEVKYLFQYINQLQEAPEISDIQLLELHNKMLPFFKN